MVSKIGIIFLCIAVIILSIQVWRLSRIISKQRQAKKRHYAGRIVCNTSDPEKDIMRLELEMAFGDLITKESVYFLIDNESEESSS